MRTPNVIIAVVAFILGATACDKPAAPPSQPTTTTEGAVAPAEAFPSPEPQARGAASAEIDKARNANRRPSE